MAFDMKTHNVKVRAGKQVLIRVNPHVRLSHAGYPPVFLQDGRAYAENGEEYKPIPGWVKEEIAKLSDATKRETGFAKPTEAEVGKATAVLEEENKGRGWGQPEGEPGITVTEAATRAATGDTGKPGKMPRDQTEVMAGTHGKRTTHKPTAKTIPPMHEVKQEVPEAVRQSPRPGETKLPEGERRADLTGPAAATHTPSKKGETKLSDADVNAQLNELLADEPDDPAPTSKRK